jgi:hypothetical protein
VTEHATEVEWKSAALAVMARDGAAFDVFV